MKVRKLTKRGLSEFSRFIQQLKEGQELQTPHYLLENPEYSNAIELDLDVTTASFSSRYEMGEYLVEILKREKINSYLGDAGFWSWFALLWFDQLCPTSRGKRAPSMEYNYILSPKYNHRPRHAIYMTWQLVSRYGSNALFLLGKEMSKRGELTEQMMGRQENLSTESVIKLASKLYLDPETRTFKRGAASRHGAGCIARYISWLDQLRLTYDLFSISSEDLGKLLPSEFDRFRSFQEPA